MSGPKTTIGWALLLLAAAVAVPLSSLASKAGPPIILSIAPAEALEPGKIAEFTVTASVLVDTDDFLLEVDLPDTLAVFSDDRRWHGPMARGEQRLMRFAIRVPEEGVHRLTAKARIVTAVGVMSAQAIYEIGPGARNEKPSPDRPTTAPNGSGVREYVLP